MLEKIRGFLPLSRGLPALLLPLPSPPASSLRAPTMDSSVRSGEGGGGGGISERRRLGEEDWTSRLNALRVPGSGSSCRDGRFLSSFLAAPSPLNPSSSPLASRGKAPDPVQQPHLRIPDPSFFGGGETESPGAARALGGGDGNLTQ